MAPSCTGSLCSQSHLWPHPPQALARPGDPIAVGVPAACLFNPRAFLQPSAVRHLPRPRRPPSTSEGVAVVDQPPFPLRSLSSPADVSSTAIADEDQKGDLTICAAARIQRAARHKAARGLTTDAARLLPRRPPSASEGVAVVDKPSFPLLSPSPPTDQRLAAQLVVARLDVNCADFVRGNRRGINGKSLETG